MYTLSIPSAVVVLIVTLPSLARAGGSHPGQASASTTGTVKYFGFWGPGTPSEMASDDSPHPLRFR